MRRVLGGILLAVGGVALLPLLVQVMALETGRVGTPSAQYGISAANGLVHCSVPSQITLKANAPNTGAFFQCTNNFASAVYLNWSAADDGGLGLTVSGGDTLTADGLAACRTVEMRANTTTASPVTVIFRGQSSSTDPFYVDLYFTGQVFVDKGVTPGGGCP
ncbi:MAG: hypothetical protein ACOY93_09080 [Bacillota bacterium]